MAAAAALSSSASAPSSSASAPSTGPSSVASVLSAGSSVPFISFFRSAAVSAGPSSSAAAALWWDSFIPLFEELDASPRSSPVPESLASKITLWFRSPMSGFRPCSEASAIALQSPEILVGSQRLTVLPPLRDIALRLSKCMGLDQVQSYVLVNRVFLMKAAACNVNREEIFKEVETQSTVGDSGVVMGEEAITTSKRLSDCVAGTSYIVRSIERLLKATNSIRRSIDEMLFDEADAHGTTGWAKIFRWGILTAIETRVTVGTGPNISVDGEKWDRLTDKVLMLRAGDVSLSQSCTDAILDFLDEHPNDLDAITVVDRIIDRLYTDVRLNRILQHIREEERAHPRAERDISTLVFANSTTDDHGRIPDLTMVTVTSSGVVVVDDSRSVIFGIGREYINKRLGRLKEDDPIESVMKAVRKAFTVATLDPYSGGKLVTFGAFRDVNNRLILLPWRNASSTRLPDPEFNIQALIEEENNWE